MADELEIAAALKFSKDGESASLDAGLLQITVSGSAYKKGTQEIGTDEEALLMGDVGTAGYVLLVNRDDTNFVEIRPGSGIADLIKIKAGEFALFRLAMDAPYAIADTAACQLEYLVIED